MRRSVAAGIWLALTVTSTLLVWTAVSFVAADVTDRPAPVVAHHEVVAALAGANQAPTTTIAPAIPAPAPTRSAPTTAPSRASSAPTTTVPIVPTGPAASTSPATTPAVPATTVPIKPAATTTTTVAPAGSTATYSTPGGVVIVQCTGFNTIRLVAALANDGFQAVQISPGPIFVSVAFAQAGHSQFVSSTCLFGQPFESTNGNNAPPPAG